MKSRTSRLGTLSIALLAGLLAVAPEALAARKKRKRTPTPTPTATPAPPRFLRAAGACVKFEPGKYLIVAEVGETGRAFQIDDQTTLEVEPRRGSRVRVFYVDGPDGPIARRVMPGPAPVPTPAP